jgi:hypothetical protein
VAGVTATFTSAAESALRQLIRCIRKHNRSVLQQSGRGKRDCDTCATTLVDATSHATNNSGSLHVRHAGHVRSILHTQAVKVPCCCSTQRSGAQSRWHHRDAAEYICSIYASLRCRCRPSDSSHWPEPRTALRPLQRHMRHAMRYSLVNKRAWIRCKCSCLVSSINADPNHTARALKTAKAQ